MKEESTTSLLHVLNHLGKENMDAYIQQHGSTSQNTNIFSEYIAEHNITTSSVVKNCTGFISKSYIYEILSGIKTQPSRDIIVILCIAAHMDRKITRRVLETYHHRDLYAKDTRDIIIATYINNKDYNLDAINDELARYQLPLLNAE